MAKGSISDSWEPHCWGMSSRASPRPPGAQPLGLLALSLPDTGGSDPGAKVAPLCWPGQKDAGAWRGPQPTAPCRNSFSAPGPLGEEAERGALCPDPLFPVLPSQIWPGPARSFSPPDTSKRNTHICICTESIPVHQNHAETPTFHIRKVVPGGRSPNRALLAQRPPRPPRLT